jgi:ATP-dependent helicase HrpB
MLPIEARLPAIRATVRDSTSLVLQAPPGAGKTTLVPTALLEEPWLNGQRIIMLEPRRIAARAAARRMSALLGERVGETVGYHVRLDRKLGPRTRIEVVTEGILTRRLQSDQSLEGVAALIFDEFHERSIHADLGLSLALDARRVLRPDLRIIVMSATLDAVRVSALLDDAPVISSVGRQFAVKTHYTPPPTRDRPLQDHAAAIVGRALHETEGSILVFLPGEGEIRRVAQRIAGNVDERTVVTPLYGALSAEEQDRAIAPAPGGMRKIVLATSIAETSLTIEGISTVVDAGLMRVPRFDPNSGMTRLETMRVSRASADQRRGRAGRLGPGVCYRLWSENDDASLEAFTRPEILSCDLAPLALDLALWGVSDPAALRWLDPPPSGAYAQALELLTQLDAIQRAAGSSHVTDHGRAMAALGVHPRLAHMLLRAVETSTGSLACDLAALLEERDILLGSDDCDMRTRLDILCRSERWPGTATLQGRTHAPSAREHVEAVHHGRLARARAQSAALHRQLKLQRRPYDPAEAGKILALAYPDRIAQRRGDSDASYLLSNGRAAHFVIPSHLSTSDYLVVTELDGRARSARIFLAAPLEAADIEELFAVHIEELEFVQWDSREKRVSARCERRYRALVLQQGSIASPDPTAVSAALITGVRQMGLASLPWTRDLRTWQHRIMFLHRLDDVHWPDVSDEALLERSHEWLEGFVGGMRSADDLQKLDLASALHSFLSHEQRREFERLAPTHVEVPSGSRITIDYLSDPPVLPVKLQEMFGQVDTPRIAGGKVTLVVHLLSPAGRPVQVTQDLRSFWTQTYQQVRKDLRGRYPKHPWPEDPLTAMPTRRTKRRSEK